MTGVYRPIEEIARALLTLDRDGTTPVVGRDNGLPVYNLAESGEPVADDLHSRVHQGVVFDLSAKLSLAGGATVYFAGTTDGKQVHFHRYNFDVSEGGIEIRLLENVQFTGGIPVVGKNRNRSSTNVPTFTVVSAPTVTDTGTELSLIGISAAATGAGRTIVSGEEPIEWILASGTPYALEFKNLDGSTAKTIYAEMTWYEPGV